jgi:hypothetical protein
MDELWELSVALMNSRVIGRDRPLSKKERAGRIQQSIRKILFFDWDPIGISHDSKLDDEYDAYVGRVYRILAGTTSEDDIIRYLHRIELEGMGLPDRDPELLRPVARKLLELDKE